MAASEMLKVIACGLAPIPALNPDADEVISVMRAALRTTGPLVPNPDRERLDELICAAAPSSVARVAGGDPNIIVPLASRFALAAAFLAATASDATVALTVAPPDAAETAPEPVASTAKSAAVTFIVELITTDRVCSMRNETRCDPSAKVMTEGTIVTFTGTSPLAAVTDARDASATAACMTAMTDPLRSLPGGRVNVKREIIGTLTVSVKETDAPSAAATAVDGDCTKERSARGEEVAISDAPLAELALDLVAIPESEVTPNGEVGPDGDEVGALEEYKIFGEMDGRPLALEKNGDERPDAVP
jgi:hypothetical protein